MSKEELKAKIKSFPQRPGVYQFRNSRGQIIYVGKAKDLKSRVGSYFNASIDPSSKTAALVARINDVSYIEVQSEIEALILEADLIKKYKPKYNIVLKDDKSSLYVVIRAEPVNSASTKKVKVPKVQTARKTDLKRSDIVFGPYLSAGSARYMLRAVRRAFPYRDCSTQKYSSHQRLNRPCLYGDLNLCSAPCTGKISVADYKKELKRLEKFLRGNSDKLIKSLNSQMTKASHKQEFELAAKLRDIIKRLEFLKSSFRRPEEYVENPYLTDDIANRALESLVAELPILSELPSRIECYDISNISGKEATGSMVVAVDGKLEKSDYRKFKIKSKEEPDDVSMLREVLERRLTRVTNGSWPVPDLIVLDGGKGQLSAVLSVLEEKNVVIPVVGLAKKEEIIIYYDNSTNSYTELKLPADAEGLKLLIRLRDEAHRFAQSYHHKLRLKQLNR